MTLRGHDNFVVSVAWSQDGTRLATASSDGTSKVWDASTGKEMQSMRGHDSFVVSVAWSPDGKRLAMGNNQKTANVWDASGGKELLRFWSHGGAVWGVAWIPDSKRLATADGDGFVQIYAMGILDLMIAWQRVTAPPSDEGCQKYLQVENCAPFPTLAP